ncbi:tam domain methyltransferase, partial [Colletotrichum incanum]
LEDKDGTQAEDDVAHRLFESTLEAKAKAANELGLALEGVLQYDQMMRKAGLKNVRGEKHLAPVNSWPTEENAKKAGKKTAEILTMSLEEWCRGPLVRAHHLEPQVLIDCASSRHSLRDERHKY